MKEGDLEPRSLGRTTRDAPPEGRRGYGAALGVSLVVVTVGVAWAFGQLAPGSRTASAPAVVPLEVGDTMTVRNVEHIRPDAAAYEAFGEVDREWRSIELARLRQAELGDAPVAPWRASAEQLLDDAVYMHTREGRLADAVELLERWLLAHPADVQRHRSAAALLAQLGRRDAALAHRAAAVRARPGDDALRTEYARELTWAGRYAEAAVEWRALVARHPADRAARIALAQALAWSGATAEAEPLLDALVAESPTDTVLRAQLRVVRGDLKPTPAETERWLAQDPGYRPYRVAHARALDRARLPAIAAWDAALADSATAALYSEAAGSAAEAADSVRSARLLGRAVLLAPADRDLRARWAQALAWSGDRAGAVREYGALIAERDDARLRLARGRLLVWGGQLRAGTVDLERSAQLEPSYEAFALLGDVLRWNGDHGAARVMYEQALALRPDDPAMVRAVAAARQAEALMRSAALLASGGGGDAPGLTLSSRYAEDNTGYLYFAARVAQGVAIGRSTVVGLAAEQRRVTQRFAHARSRWLTGYTFGVSASHDLGVVHVAATGGLARHALVRDVPYGSLSAGVRRRGASLVLEASQTTAYEQLWAMRTLVDWEAAAAFAPRPLTARTYTVRGSLPVGRAGVELTVDRTRLGDGNARLGGSIAARAPIGRGLSAVYTGGAMTYSDPAGAYWAPRRYDGHAAGLEYVQPLARGVRVAARVMPGVVRSDDRLRGVSGEPVGISAWSPQVTAGGDLVVERQRWSAALTAGVGQGGRGAGGQQGYRAMSGAITVRARW